jgi:hypothetical protein
MVQREQAALAKRDSQEHGVNLYAEPFLTEDAIEEGLEFSDFRRPYLIDRAKRMGLIPEEAEV